LNSLESFIIHSVPLVKWSQKWSPTTGTLPYQGW
jgi:hypothetical protein